MKRSKNFKKLIKQLIKEQVSRDQIKTPLKGPVKPPPPHTFGVSQARPKMTPEIQNRINTINSMFLLGVPFLPIWIDTIFGSPNTLPCSTGDSP